ncbi:ATP-binding cassette domain-containing protein [Pseudomonas sp. IT-P291]|uniref:ATP-binding cassette domain-containing protein n=1 Tax=Pseudomonas sp. IT-P291 TaxID=3026448 RepID=UPI0039E0524C
MSIIRFENVDVIFAARPKPALDLLDQGFSRPEILQKTGLIVGVEKANLEINKGEICVLMGLSGSGKSSLLRCINGLNTVSRGKLFVEHEGRQIDIASCTPAELKMMRTQRIAMVFQKFALMPWLTVRENISFGLEMQGRALAMDADILLMDEPFCALDPLIRQGLQDELLDLQRKLHKTIVFVSHDLDEALKLGTRIAIMKDGKIIQYSKPEEIVLNPADDYVRNFVAHTNPLNVLCAKSLMTALDRCVFARDEYCLDTVQNLWMVVNPPRHLTSVRKGATPAHVQSWNPTERIETLARQPTCVPPTTTMRDALQIRYETGHPLIVQDEAGTVLGILGDGELYRALLGHNLSYPVLSEPAREPSVA